MRILIKTLFHVDLDIKSEEDRKRLEECTRAIEPFWIGSVLACSFLCPPLLKTKMAKNYIEKKLRPLKNMARKIIDNPSEDSLWKKVSRDGNLSWEEFENSAVFFYDRWSGNYKQYLMLFTPKSDKKS